ncbi:alpha/beta fold hydrolase [Methylorubrum thiocyanatum]|uniref:alpha/beta fold hydrolase n=1 Tax=Methylorubrum thiocyanatum TaxID=47958 RepID=UPI00398C52A6
MSDSLQNRSGPLVFLGGGPGLAVAYAAEPLRRAGLSRDWAFFEQPGCSGEPEPVTADSVRDAAAAFVAGRAGEGPVTLVAHSWGAWLALALLERLPAGTIARAVLLHPAPPTRAGLDAAVTALFGRLSPEAMGRAAPLMARTDPEAGRTIMTILLPAYCGRETDLPDLDLALIPRVYHGVSMSLGAYDQRGIVAAYAERLTLVFGEADVFSQRLYAQHYGDLSGLDVVTLPGGHFGFLEDLAGFEAILRERGIR